MNPRLRLVIVTLAGALCGCSLFNVDVKSEEHREETKVEDKDKDKEPDHTRSN